MEHNIMHNSAIFHVQFRQAKSTWQTEALDMTLYRKCNSLPAYIFNISIQHNIAIYSVDVPVYGLAAFSRELFGLADENRVWARQFLQETLEIVDPLTVSSTTDENEACIGRLFP